VGVGVCTGAWCRQWGADKTSMSWDSSHSWRATACMDTSLSLLQHTATHCNSMYSHLCEHLPPSMHRQPSIYVVSSTYLFASAHIVPLTSVCVSLNTTTSMHLYAPVCTIVCAPLRMSTQASMYLNESCHTYH